MEPHFKRFYIIVIEICSNFEATSVRRQRNKDSEQMSERAKRCIMESIYVDVNDEF